MKTAKIRERLERAKQSQRYWAQKALDARAPGTILCEFERDKVVRNASIRSRKAFDRIWKYEAMLLKETKSNASN